MHLLVDVSRTIFAHDNDPALELKLGINKWEDIAVLPLERLEGEPPGASSVRGARLVLHDDVFAVDYVIQDLRSGKARRRLRCNGSRGQCCLYIA